MTPGLDQVMTVYTRTGGTGPYNLQVATGVACRLAHVSQQDATTGADRAELAGRRRLLWDPAYLPPSENVQITVSGVYGPDGVTPARWNLQAGTHATLRGPGGDTLFRRADAVRAA